MLLLRREEKVTNCILTKLVGEWGDPTIIEEAPASSYTIVSLISVFQILADIQIHLIGLRMRYCQIDIYVQNRTVAWCYYYTSLLWDYLRFLVILRDF